MMKYLELILLFVAGAILSLVGYMAAFDPHTLYATNNVMLDRNPALLSEIRAPGAALLLASGVILSAVFIQAIRSFAWGLAAIIYAGYGLGRIISFIIDGAPPASLFMAMMIELIFALVALWMVRRRNKMGHSSAALSS